MFVINMFFVCFFKSMYFICIVSIRLVLS